MVHITIVGLKPNQSCEVERHFAGMSKFRFLPAERSNTRLPSGTDWVIVTKFAGHRWWDAASCQLPGRRVMFCNGGVVSVLKQVAFALEKSEALNSAA